MVDGLRKYFPMIRTEKEILTEIRERDALNVVFQKWTQKQQRDFLNMATGMRGVKVLYDSYFKEIFNPELRPERLEAFLSLLLKQRIKIKAILPGDSSRIADESSLLIMDILVELENGSLANVEAQKIGYKFPGQRCACYSSDLLLRQYKRIREQRREAFSYRDIKKVYTIVLLETSTEEFHVLPRDYVHHVRPKADTGLDIDFLQEYILIPLDIFRQNLYNKGIENQLDAWLTFLSVDDVEWIEKLIQQYPEFIPLYKDVYTLCMNTENIMGIFSEELKILDRNTTLLMIDEMQEKINAQENIIRQKDEALLRDKDALRQKDEALSQKDEEILRLRRLLDMKNEKD